ncbi:MAG: drug/metabolite transporter (DMT)-like permease [Candidatus Midichloriaceae bacterium]|jgi:drug/metabolite transporter (DMT)-like permease
MTANALFMSLLYVIVKILTRDMNFSSNQVGLLYKVSIVIITLISCLKLGFIYHLKTKKLLFHALRGFFSIIGSLSMFYAVSILNVVDAAAISELTPAVMVIAGVLVFNEKLTSPKILLLLGSVLGIFFIIDFQKFGKNIDVGYIYAFIALIFWSINNVIVKKLTKTERSRAQLFYSSFFASIFALPFALFSFPYDSVNSSFGLVIREWPIFSVSSVLLVICAGMASLLHKVSFFRAYKLSDMSVVGPYDYLRLPFTGLFAYIFLNEKITDPYSFVGYAIIVASGIYFIMHKGESKSKN